jgi:anti-sigma factor (TIGR02949 family)
MIECKEIFAHLSEYLDAELPLEDCDQIRAHIAACGPCVEFVDSLKHSIELCHEFQVGANPPPLKAEVRDELLECYRKALAARSKRD